MKGPAHALAGLFMRVVPLMGHLPSGHVSGGTGAASAGSPVGCRILSRQVMRRGIRKGVVLWVIWRSGKSAAPCGRLGLSSPSGIRTREIGNRRD